MGKNYRKHFESSSESSKAIGSGVDRLGFKRWEVKWEKMKRGGLKKGPKMMKGLERKLITGDGEQEKYPYGESRKRRK